MERVNVNGKWFRINIPEAEVLKRVQAVADRLNKDMADKNPLFLAVLNGSFIFAADLMRRITIPSEISFVKMASYQGTSTTGNVKELIGVNTDLSGRTVVILEDIVESGLTLKSIFEQLKSKNPASVHICTLLFKPEKLQTDVDVEYVGMEIPNDFILGYGLDYDGQGRNLRDIYVIE